MIYSYKESVSYHALYYCNLIDEHLVSKRQQYKPWYAYAYPYVVYWSGRAQLACSKRRKSDMPSDPYADAAVHPLRPRDGSNSRPSRDKEYEPGNDNWWPRES